MMSILINNKSTVFYNSRRLKYQKKFLRLFNINEKLLSREKTNISLVFNSLIFQTLKMLKYKLVKNKTL